MYLDSPGAGERDVGVARLEIREPQVAGTRHVGLDTTGVAGDRDGSRPGQRDCQFPGVDSPNAEFLRGTTIEVGSDRPFVIYGDGDPIGATPATMRVEPRCLRVIVPA